jgi:glyoxylase-like metal-dependent hydrolase (beta-lactamase superfamily II)
MRSIRLFALLAAALSGCAQPTPEQQVVDDAAAALGGRERIQAVSVLTMEGEGTNWNLGQDMTPEATGQTFTISDYRLVVDLAGDRSRVEQTRTPNFPYFQGQAPQRLTAGHDGAIAYNVAPNGTATRAADQVAMDRRAARLHHPLAIVRAALDPASKVTNARTEDNERLVDVTTGLGRTFTLAIDAATGLPTGVVSMAYNTNLGDVAIETSFADYQEIDGLKLPARGTTKTDRHTTAEIRATRQAFGGEAAGLAAPAAAASAAAITGPPPANVTAEEVAKGVWLLAGQSHHSVLVEFADHLTLIEAPQNDLRTLAVIAKARELRPDKPLTHLVSTHHHFDHSGGLRAAVSEGLTIVTHKANAAYYQEAVERPHTIVADALAKSPKPLKIQTVDGELILKDANMTVHLYHIAGNPHADTLLMAYFPRERILVEADVYSPAAAVHPYAANLLENVRRLKLRVDRIVPIHGQIVPFSDLVKVTSAVSSD